MRYTAFMMVQTLFERSRVLAAFSGAAVFGEPMSAHTSFKIGGPADLYIRPDAGCFVPYVAALLGLARGEGVPVFILGGGANLLVADSGVRGIVLDTGAWSGGVVAPVLAGADAGRSGAEVRFRSGTLTDEAVRWAVAGGLSGFEDFAGLPGTVGGAVWMNARCYESSVSDVLVSVTFLDECLEMVTVRADPADFAYKKSPFQGRDTVILEAAMLLCAGDAAGIAEKAAVRRADREEKGHFRYPSAGSVFKNNRDFGRPSGKIIDELGLRGFREGGAQIAPWHGNFIVNTGGATANDVQRLIALVQERAMRVFGFALEPEVILVGGR
ncbi:MAG: UDP-N-acetylmuramate dehydrogenase [Spirochaetaceae bacterium]|nr:UDP-N-acetylmuramate dehydrogenase [Spirochaetaceae bacterium]